MLLLPRLRWPGVQVGSGYVPLNFQNYRCQSMVAWAKDPRWTQRGADSNFDASAVWKELLQPFGLGPMRDVCYHCCSQFAVSREAVRLRPRRFYEQLLHLSLTPGTAHIAWLLEYTWHLIFGKPAKMAKVDRCEVVARVSCAQIRTRN
jgi:hypothetical protein|mmetsp:Transcript_12848/g.33685  ORF Transcript_12848/g.33685 Transcript_12848/m.33685 type:complete len:148 (+) Transcript_12848:77-520(+)